MLLRNASQQPLMRGGSSIYTINDFTPSGPADHYGVISPTSFRFARTDAGTGRFDRTSVPSGTYRITGVLSAWDGAAIGALSTQFRVVDQFTQRFAVTALGAFDSGPIVISSGTLTFIHGATGLGCRIDEFNIEAA